MGELKIIMNGFGLMVDKQQSKVTYDLVYFRQNK